MSISLNQKGSSHLVLILAVAVIAAVGIVGYRVVSNKSSAATGSTSSSQKAASTSSKSSTLQSASTELNSTNPDSSINPNQLDSDLNSVL